MIYCQSAGCGGQRTGYSRYCSKHATRHRRHGHCDQQGITAGRLKPYIDRVHSYIVRHGADALWTKLETVLESTLKDARGTLAWARSGRPFHRWEGEAAAELVRVAESAPPRRIIETVAAMQMLWDQESGSFRSDNAAWTQTSRRFRSLSAVTKRRYWGTSDGTLKTVTRDIRSDVAVILGRTLHIALGGIGRKIAEGEHAEHNRRAIIRQEAYSALRPHPDHRNP